MGKPFIEVSWLWKGFWISVFIKIHHEVAFAIATYFSCMSKFALDERLLRQISCFLWKKKKHALKKKLIINQKHALICFELWLHFSKPVMCILSLLCCDNAQKYTCDLRPRLFSVSSCRSRGVEVWISSFRQKQRCIYLSVCFMASGMAGHFFH